MLNAIGSLGCINQRFAFKNSRILYLALIFNNPRTTVLYAKKLVAGGKIRRVIYRFFRGIDTNQWFISGSGESQWVRRHGFYSWWVLKLSASPLPFCVALSPSVHWHVRFLYCCALYNCFFFGFCQWQSCTDRVVNLYTLATILLPLFWRTWTRALASTRPHVLAWHVGRDYSYCGALELTGRQVRGFVFSWYGVHRSNTSTMQFVQNNLGHFSKDLLLSRIQVTN